MDINNTKDSGDSQIANVNTKHLLELYSRGELNEQQRKSLLEVIQTGPGIWKTLGDLGAQLRFQAIDQFGNDEIVRASVMRGMNEMRTNLKMGALTASELLVVEQILTCTLQCQIIGMKLEANTRGSHSMTQGAYWDKRYTHAMNRLNRSIELLAKLHLLYRS